MLAAVFTRRRRAAPAQVPCTNIGGGHYECNWYRAGRRLSPAARWSWSGTTTVGYLPQGKNWIVCQQAGRRHAQPAEGNSNNWFGWTEAENGKMGWASPLDAVGGDNYGNFGGGDAELQRRARRAADLEGVWGSPAPRPAGRDRDAGAGAEGRRRPETATPPTSTATTLNRHVHPGATEVPNDGVDQDCSGADAAGRLSAVVGFSWTTARLLDQGQDAARERGPAGRDGDRHLLGQAQGLPEADKTFTTSAKGGVTMTKMFRKRVQGRRRDHRGGQRDQHGRPRQALHDPPQGRPAHPDALPRPGSAKSDALLSRIANLNPT